MNMVFGAPARGRLGFAALFCLFLVIAFPSRALAQNAGVQLTVTNDWGSGFTAEVKITNTSTAPISGWTLEFDLAANIVNLWNGAFTKSTTHYTVKNASWNGNLAPGGSATFGFQANYSGTRPNPSNCIFNGGACSFGGDVVPPAAGGLKVNWTIANDWGSGYQADVQITNNSGVAVSGWDLQFDLGGIVSNIWNASLTTNGNHRTVQNAAWNGSIGAGGSVSFGFTGSYSGTRPDPSNCNINGSACVFEGLTPGGGDPPPPLPPPTPPSISIVSPASNTTVSGTAVSIVAETGGDGITSVQFFVDGAGIGQDTSSPYSVSWNTTTVNNGVHSLTAKANTSSQSVTSNSVSVNVQQPVLPPAPPPSGVEGFLSISGSQLLNSDGNPVRLTGVNWFGFETQNRVVHGLWSRDYRSMLHQIHDLGFNVLRIPWSNGIFDAGAQSTSITFSGADPYDGRSPLNQPLAGKTPIQILDLVIEEAGRLGLKVFLDNHSRRPDAFASEDLWYTQDFSEQQWIDHWVVMAERYKNNPTVIGFDLDNEPHGRSTWGSGETASDWAAAAERCAAAIHAVHPDALIIVEGIESYNGANYWWGGNLRGVRNRPLNINPAKLIYSPHDYSPEVYAQPWFFDPSYPNNLETVWDEAWGFIRRENRGYLLLGEFGIQSQTSHGGKSLVWIQRLVAYMGSTMSWTFWTINPNSGDTGGILQDDWVSVNQWKVDILSPYLAPQFPAP